MDKTKIRLRVRLYKSNTFTNHQLMAVFNRIVLYICVHFSTFYTEAEFMNVQFR
jgi:hypothetical protein